MELSFLSQENPFIDIPSQIPRTTFGMCNYRVAGKFSPQTFVVQRIYHPQKWWMVNIFLLKIPKSNMFSLMEPMCQLWTDCLCRETKGRRPRTKSKPCTRSWLRLRRQNLTLGSKWEDPFRKEVFSRFLVKNLRNARWFFAFRGNMLAILPLMIWDLEQAHSGLVLQLPLGISPILNQLILAKRQQTDGWIWSVYKVKHGQTKVPWFREVYPVLRLIYFKWHSPNHKGSTSTQLLWSEASAVLGISASLGPVRSNSFCFSRSIFGTSELSPNFCTAQRYLRSTDWCQAEIQVHGCFLSSWQFAMWVNSICELGCLGVPQSSFIAWGTKTASWGQNPRTLSPVLKEKQQFQPVSVKPP